MNPKEIIAQLYLITREVKLTYQEHLELEKNYHALAAWVDKKIQEEQEKSVTE